MSKSSNAATSAATSASRWSFDVAVVSSATPPWATGPSTLTFPQACGLQALGYRVVYVVPWLSERDQTWLWGEPGTQLSPYRVFINPSRSEVLCTATASQRGAARLRLAASLPALGWTGRSR